MLKVKEVENKVLYTDVCHESSDQASACHVPT